MAKNIFVRLICLIGLGCVNRADGQTTKLVVAYASPAATFCPGVIATGGFDFVVIATETRYVPLRMMVNASIQTPAQLRGKRLGAGQAGLDEYATILYLEKIGLTPN